MHERPPQTLDRRTFLRLLFATGAAATLPPSYNNTHQLPSNVLMIDFARHAPRLNVHQSPEFQGNRKFLRRNLGEAYISQLELVAQYGHQIANPDSALQSRIMAEHPQAAFLHSLLHAFSDHSDYVVGAMNNLWRRTGYAGVPYLYPIQELMDVTFGQDELENPMLTTKLDPQKVIAAIAKYPQVPIVNLSWQCGSNQVIYQRTGIDIGTVDTPLVEARTHHGHTLFYSNIAGEMHHDEYTLSQAPVVVSRKTGQVLRPLSLAQLNRHLTDYYLQNAQKKLENPPRVIINGAYTSSVARSSISDLLTVVRSFPQKLFLVAGGNFSDDLTEIRSSLPDWPPNILIAAQWSQLARPHGNMYGADIYVNNNQLGLVHGSSLSTVTLSAACSVLQHMGYSHPDIVRFLRHYTDQSAYHAYIHNRFTTIRNQAVRHLVAPVFKHPQFTSELHISNKTSVCRRL